MSDEARQRILGLHNFVRNQFAEGIIPGWREAANMRQLTWDDTLAEVALMWAFQCMNGVHDKCRKTPKFADVGQNWGVVSNDRDYPDGVFQIFQNWLDEVSLAPGSIVKKFKSKPRYNHFTAIVWGDTYKIGCGLVNYTSIYTGSTTYKQTMVCNYGPAGNVVGKPMWRVGEPCKTCPIAEEKNTDCRTNATYSFLCALPDDPKDEHPITIDIPARQACAFDFKSLVLLAATFQMSLIT